MKKDKKNIESLILDCLYMTQYQSDKGTVTVDIGKLGEIEKVKKQFFMANSENFVPIFG